jgi:hypothetical protein
MPAQLPDELLELLDGPMIVPEGFTARDVDKMIRDHEAQTIGAVWDECEQRIRAAYERGTAAGIKEGMEIEQERAAKEREVNA